MYVDIVILNDFNLNNFFSVINSENKSDDQQFYTIFLCVVQLIYYDVLVSCVDDSHIYRAIFPCPWVKNAFVSDGVYS